MEIVYKFDSREPIQRSPPSKFRIKDVFKWNETSRSPSQNFPMENKCDSYHDVIGFRDDVYFDIEFELRIDFDVICDEEMIYCFINNIHVDYAELLWEGLHYSLMNPTRLIPYPRFTKIIVDHFMTKNSKIPKRLHKHYHRVENDKIVKSIFNSGKNKEGKGIWIPDWMLTVKMKQTNHYQLTLSASRLPNPANTQGEPSAPCKPTIIRFLIPRQPYPETPIPTVTEIDIESLDEATRLSIATQRSLEDLEAQQNVKKVQEHLVNEEIETMVEGTENVDEDEFMDEIFIDQEDPDTRLEPRSHKESPEVKKSGDVLIIHDDDEEEESVGDVLKRRKGKGI
ncbi:hypothetical protein Tco_0769995 [Tanacetum coccineum]|uniref:Uncharacterized protein n=1 Tax=Tanacetum coccineum TaxID=301880 RepID=A0ABQ4ZAX5_9ASTR